MALRIEDAALLPDVDGTEKIPTGGRGDLAVTTEQIKDYMLDGLAADDVGYLAPFTGAQLRTQLDKNTDTASVFDFFTPAEIASYKSTPTFDATAAIQRAINSGKNIDFVGRVFYVNNLTQSISGQCFVSTQGAARFVKNSNGPILNSSAAGFTMHNINWRGDNAVPTFTGDGVVSSGDNPQFINCGGRWITGRPLKATGNHVIVWGTCDIYQTTDTSANGYDIEIGRSGAATLYHQIFGVYTSQNTGGILLVDTGSHSLHGGQIGKLYIKAGTKPSGVNGGITVGARILGNVTIEQSNAVFTSNQFDAINIVFAAGTSYCSLDTSNIVNSAAVITNSGNQSNNLIVRNYGTGSDNAVQLLFGDDTNKRAMRYSLNDLTKGYQFDAATVTPNNYGYRSFGSDNTTIYNLIYISSTNSVQVGALTGQYTYFLGTNIGFNTAAGTQVRISDGFIAPFSDALKLLGTSSLRWKQGFIQDVHLYPSTSVSPTVNSEMVFEATSNTQLKIKLMGTDGVVRSATLTLA